MKLSMQVGLSPGHIALGGDPAPAQFSAHICCGQMAAWIKKSLGIALPCYTVIRFNVPLRVNIERQMVFEARHCRQSTLCSKKVQLYFWL